MKHILNTLAIFIIFNGIAFISISFYSLKLNPLNWDEDARFLYSICILISAFRSYVYYIEES